ncbi:hypothetical protein H1R20_g456, partial [Candolleomyces eurysporus]
MAAPEIAASSLSQGEYIRFTRILKTLGRSKENAIGQGLDGDDERWKMITVPDSLVRIALTLAWNGVLSEETIDTVLKLFEPYEVLTGGQIFAVLRLLTHAQNGKGVDISLVTCPATPSASLKRAASISQYERLKKAKLAVEAPSALAKDDEYKIMQGNSVERVLDDRPKPDLNIPPIALLYSGFGEFQDTFKSSVTPRNQKEERTFRRFADAMTLPYSSDAERQKAAVDLINAIFEAHNVSARLGLGANTGLLPADAYALGPNNFPIVVSDIRNEAVADAHSNIRLASYGAHFHILVDDKARELFERWRVPYLGITIVGPYVTFYGVILLGHQYRLVHLTPGLSCDESSTDGRDRKALYAAFVAASRLIELIDDDIYSHLNMHPPDRILDDAFNLPAVSGLRKHDPGVSSGSHARIEFRITGRYYSDVRRDERQLFYATLTSGIDDDQPATTKEILVKFSKTYSIELHDYCFEQGHAPRVYGFERLPGGWYGIAMEYLEDTVSLDRSHLKDEVMRLMKGFHDKDLVHGDLRSANIRVRPRDEARVQEGEEDKQFWVIDFDWGGKVGEAKYPTFLLNEALTRGRDHPEGGLKIYKDDDERVVRDMFWELGLKRA